MRKVELGDTGLHTSVLGFGCAPMGGRISERQSLRALALAYDQGITFYDTARSYGYGDAEKVLGRFIRGRRDRVVVSTKCGISVGTSSPTKRLIKSLARSVFRVVPRLRRSLRSRLGRQHQTNRFDLTDLSASVETSLRELRTDYIDILFLHDCPMEVLQRPEVFDLLDAFVKRGLVRHFGVSAKRDVVEAYFNQNAPRGRVVQYAHNLATPHPGAALAAHAGVAAVANQPFAGGAALAEIRTRVGSLASRLASNDSLHNKLFPLTNDALTDLALNAVVRGTGTHVAVCSMFDSRHIIENVRAIENSRFSDEDLARVRAHFSI